MAVCLVAGVAHLCHVAFVLSIWLRFGMSVECQGREAVDEAGKCGELSAKLPYCLFAWCCEALLTHFFVQRTMHPVVLDQLCKRVLCRRVIPYVTQ